MSIEFSRQGSKRGRPQFRATRQWNHIVSSFQQDIPIKSHVRYHFKTYHDCFTATHAVTWLKNFFAENGMYGDVTTAQVEKLGQKLVDMGVIYEITKGTRVLRRTSIQQSFTNGPVPYRLNNSQNRAKENQSVSLSLNASSVIASPVSRRATVCAPSRRRAEPYVSLSPPRRVSLPGNDRIQQSSGCLASLTPPAHRKWQCSPNSQPTHDHNGGAAGNSLSAVRSTSIPKREGSSSPLSRKLAINLAEAGKSTAFHQSAGSTCSLGSASYKAGELQLRDCLQMKDSGDSILSAAPSTLSAAPSALCGSECSDSSRGLSAMSQCSSVNSSRGSSPRTHRPVQQKRSLQDHQRQTITTVLPPIQPAASNCGANILNDPDAWKETVLSRLLQRVDIPTLEAIIHCVDVDGEHIASNCGYSADTMNTFVPMTNVLGKRRCSWPSAKYLSQDFGGPMFDCEWSDVHALCPRSASGVNISYTPLICSAMDFLSCYPREQAKTCCQFWAGRGVEDIVPTIAQHFRRVVDKPVIPCSFYPLFIATHLLIRNNKIDRAIEALQYCILLLPRARLVLLERILNFFSACDQNDCLCLQEGKSNLLVLCQAIGPSVLQPTMCDEWPSSEEIDIISFMAVHVSTVLQIPNGLVDEVRTLATGGTISMKSSSAGSIDSALGCESVEVPSIVCENISETALLELLDVIVKGEGMTKQQRRHHLKEYKKVYPRLYGQRFYNDPGEDENRRQLRQRTWSVTGTVHRVRTQMKSITNTLSFRRPNSNSAVS